MVDEKNTVMVDVGSWDVEMEYCSFENIDDGRVLSDFETFLSEAKDSIPEHLHDSARISIGGQYEGGYDITISYARPETKDEEHDRRVTEANAAAETNQRERNQYERLKAKFEKEDGG